jgi:hypothetical protein
MKSFIVVLLKKPRRSFRNLAVLPIFKRTAKYEAADEHLKMKNFFTKKTLPNNTRGNIR